jgi:hypothetical protein
MTNDEIGLPNQAGVLARGLWQLAAWQMENGKWKIRNGE